MINKKQMTKEEIKLNFITPAIEATWNKSSIRMEFPVTLGRIMIDGKKTYRQKRGEADYLLFHNNSGEWFPLAVVEAKDNNHSVLGGMGQAKKYAKAMKVYFPVPPIKEQQRIVNRLDSLLPLCDTALEV